MKKKLKEFFEDAKKENGKQSKKLRNLTMIGLLGLLLLIVSNIFSESSNESQLEIAPPRQEQQEAKSAFSGKKSSSTSNVQELETSYEKELQEMLEKIQGVSNVEVMVNLESTKVKVYQKNLITGQQTTDETDKNGGTREIQDNTKETQVVLVHQGDKEVPLLIQTKKPEVRGVFVVAKGVDHAQVKKWVVEATSRVLDVPTHRVSVMPKN